MRDIQSLELVPELSQNVNYKKLEAKLSSKGIKLLMKKIEDDAVEVQRVANRKHSKIDNLPDDLKGAVEQNAVIRLYIQRDCRLSERE